MRLTVQGDSPADITIMRMPTSEQTSSAQKSAVRYTAIPNICCARNAGVAFLPRIATSALALVGRRGNELMANNQGGGRVCSETGQASTEEEARVRMGARKEAEFLVCLRAREGYARTRQESRKRRLSCCS